MSPSDQVYQPAATPLVTGRPASGPGTAATNGTPPPGPSSEARPGPSVAPSTAPPAGGTSPTGQPVGGGQQYPRPDVRRGPAPAPGQQAPAGPRKVRLTLARVDPWSVLKLSFLLSVAMGIGLVTAAIILWVVVHSMGVFDQLNSTFRDVGGTNSTFDIYAYVGLGRVVSLSTFVGVINIIIIMALSTLGAFLYNIAATLVGGLHVTLSDD